MVGGGERVRERVRQACSEQQPAFIHQQQPARTLCWTTAAAGGAPELRSCSHPSHRQTEAIFYPPKNQWVREPGTARVYAHYHVTATRRLNGFPSIRPSVRPSVLQRNWHTARAGLVFSLLLFKTLLQYNMFLVGRRCVNPWPVYTTTLHLLLISKKEQFYDAGGKKVLCRVLDGKTLLL